VCLPPPAALPGGLAPGSALNEFGRVGGHRSLGYTVVASSGRADSLRSWLLVAVFLGVSCWFPSGAAISSSPSRSSRGWDLDLAEVRATPAPKTCVVCVDGQDELGASEVVGRLEKKGPLSRERWVGIVRHRPWPASQSASQPPPPRTAAAAAPLESRIQPRGRRWTRWAATPSLPRCRSSATRVRWQPAAS
jgi:hypothetical protein